MTSPNAMLNATHDVRLSSWVASANAPDTDFPVQNLPHGVFRRRGSADEFRGGVAIGDNILDLAAARAKGCFDGGAVEKAAAAAAAPQLNEFMAMGHAAWSGLRLRLSQLLRADAPDAARLRDCLLPQAEAEFAVPARVGDYTDFLCSYHHMRNMGRIVRADAAELPNFKWLPIAYHGRSSSIAISGTDFRRPHGQARATNSAQPIFGPTRKLDYEVELGFFVGPGNARGEPVAIADAEKRIFGVCLLNDWSARDVQGWESTPLGPFLSKSFITSISPWIVTMEALAPFRCPLPRAADDPAGFPYLADGVHESAGVDVQIEALLRVQETHGAPVRLSRTSSRHTYWSLAQMLVHHTEGGCVLRSGDLMGTGTQSGPTRGEEGCLMELTSGGREPVTLAGGQTRVFLEDGDIVVLRGWCERPGQARIGFGECSGTVLPALD